MKLVKHVCMCITYMSFYTFFAQQISTDNTLSLESLVQTNLGQNCVEISNISSASNGQVNGIDSYGSFSKANSNFPFQNGIILSTGQIDSAGNELISNILNEGDTNWLTDPDLENALNISETINATSIEFDFVSAANLIQFNYLLASEEYNANFPCQYSDGFAFLIKEAGTPNPYTNIAVIPGTNIPVNTNTIHDEIVGFCPAENEAYFEGYNIGDTNYNGRTTVLTATASIVPNTTYHIKLIIADQSDENYDSAVFIEGNSFNASVDLGPDITTCADNADLDADIDNNLATYSWFLDNTLIPGATNPTFTATTSGTYRVEVAIELSNVECLIEDEIQIELNSQQVLEPLTDYVLCDDLLDDGVEFFDLFSKYDEISPLIPPALYSISFHPSETDAQNDTNELPQFYQNTTSPQTIYIRIEDLTNGCLIYGTFDIIVNELPEVVQPEDTVFCGINTEEFFTIDNFDDVTAELLASNPNLIISYHTTQEDANIGLNPITPPLDIPSNSTTAIFIRVVDPSTGCANVTYLAYIALSGPQVGSDIRWIDACKPEQDHAIFDLTDQLNELIAIHPDADFSVFENYNDAINDLNPITDITNYENIIPEFQLVYVKITDPVSGCSSIVTIELHTDVVETGFDDSPYQLCDDDSQDGVEGFDLNDVEANLINEYTENDFTFIFYQNQFDQDNEINALDKSQLYYVNGSDEVYVTIISDLCTRYVIIELIVNPPFYLEDLGTVNYCEEDGNNDGITLINLNIYNAYVSEGINGASVSYFFSPQDAEANINAITEEFENTTNPFTVYVRVENSITSCEDTAPLTVNVTTIPEVLFPSNLQVCDDDDDQIAEVNLLTKIPEIVSNPNNFNFKFFTNYDDALDNTNPIDNPETFTTATQHIFVRVEDAISGCSTVIDFYVFINTTPITSTISPFENCDTNTNLIADFILINKDEEILNGQFNKEVLYFETEQDAINRTNSIDKTIAYQNMSSPQTLYVRIENLTDINCFVTNSFELVVGSLPIFNTPSDIFVCDDDSSDGIENFDLNEKLNEIVSGSPENLSVSFFESYEDAETNTNSVPLNYTNSANPQQIFVRIDNGTFCQAIVDFDINVIQLPEVNTPSDLEYCDNDYDGVLTFDLTTIEVEILDVRQDNIEITYHASYDGVVSHTEIIQNPEQYANISNPQTVYVKINNTISDCYVALPINLIVNLPPAIDPIEQFDLCATETNTVDLAQVSDELLLQTPNVQVVYYPSEIDATNQTNALDELYSYQSLNDTLFARVEFTTTRCHYIHEFEILINELPIANPVNDLIACDDDYDSFYPFDLTVQNAVVLGSQNPNIFLVSYHNDQQSANENTNPLESPYLSTNNEVIFIRVENSVTGCYETTSFQTIIHDQPFVDIGNQVVCLDNLPLVVSADTNNPNDTYLWSTNQTTPAIEITEIGTYSVTVTSADGCETTEIFQVTESEAATIDVTETVDFSDPNNIVVTVSGIGNYMYQLDDGDPQLSNVFTNVSLGYHTITIIDLFGCTSVTKDIVVIDAPKFVTPNDDGYFDTWHITGIETLTGSIVYVFDRFGKLITTLSWDSEGWNGYYNGNLMPATDYWFYAKIRKGNTAFDVKGHFSLRY